MTTRSTLAALLAFAVLHAAPTKSAGQVSVGVSAGPTFATLTGDDADDEQFGTRRGFFVGGAVGIPLGDLLSIGTGAYYVQKGAEDEGALGDAALELDYLEIPALLQLRVTGGERPVGVTLEAGPTFAFNLSCGFTGNEGDVVFFPTDCDDEAGDVDVGLLFGGGLSFTTSRTVSLFLDGGIDIGLASIFDEDDVGPGIDDVRNQVWFVGAGVSWVVGG